MIQLAIIIFLITSLYSHEVNCLNMFAMIFDKNTTDENTAKCIEYYIDKLGCDANASVKLNNLMARSNLLEFAYDANKTRTIDMLLDKGATPNGWLSTSIGLDFSFFFNSNGVPIENKRASKELLKFIKTPKYKEFKEEKFKLIKKLLDHGQDPKGYILLQKVLTLVNDEEDLDNLLKNRTQKELVQ